MFDDKALVGALLEALAAGDVLAHHVRCMMPLMKPRDTREAMMRALAGWHQDVAIVERAIGEFVARSVQAGLEATPADGSIPLGGIDDD